MVAAAEEAQAAVRTEGADVTGAERPGPVGVVGEHLGGLLRVLPVAAAEPAGRQHDPARPGVGERPVLQLDLQTRTRDGPAHGGGPLGRLVVAADRVLGHEPRLGGAVAVAQDAVRPDGAAHGGQLGAVHRLPRHRHGLQPRQAARRPQRRHDAAQDGGRGQQHVRPHLAQERGQLGDRPAAGVEQLQAGPGEQTGQRGGRAGAERHGQQVGHDAARGVGARGLGVDPRVVQDRAVVAGDALGLPRRPGRVDDDGHVVGRGRARQQRRGGGQVVRGVLRPDVGVGVHDRPRDLRRRAAALRVADDERRAGGVHVVPQPDGGGGGVQDHDGVAGGDHAHDGRDGPAS